MFADMPSRMGMPARRRSSASGGGDAGGSMIVDTSLLYVIRGLALGVAWGLGAWPWGEKNALALGRAGGRRE